LPDGRLGRGFSEKVTAQAAARSKIKLARNTQSEWLRKEMKDSMFMVTNPFKTAAALQFLAESVVGGAAPASIFRSFTRLVIP
jgi:hypothetical protein